MTYTNSSVIRIALADDQDIVRAGIKSLLVDVPWVQVVGEARSGAELVEIVQTHSPDVVLSELVMQGMALTAAFAQIRRERPGVRVLLLSTHDSPEMIKQAVTAGACGYVFKSANAAELHNALARLSTTGSYFSTEIAQRLLEQLKVSHNQRLTVRQVEILRLLAQGRSSSEIGVALGLSAKTVNTHRARIMARLHLYDVASLTCYAVRQGFIKP